jgi:2-polyprenyl-3-methyl-5-hydroxy-6-metoxy-1,4-benzoquinol methylase
MIEMLSRRAKYRAYSSHYQRLNTYPDWEAAETDPARHACTKPWLPDRRDARILDFGCGWGHQLLSLWSARYENIEGVELTPEQAAIANECAQGRVPIACQDGCEYLAGKNGVYDLIILNDVLEHIPAPEVTGLLLQIKAALVASGRLAIRVPNMSNLIASFSHSMDCTHVVGYTEFSLAQVLDRAGFENHCFITDAPLARWKQWRPWAPWRHLGLRCRLNRRLHGFVYWASGKPTKPSIFSHNIEVYSHKPSEKEN